jgi:hypothetical protein
VRRRTLTLAALACSLTLPATAAASGYEFLAIGDGTHALSATAVGEHGEVVGIYATPGPLLDSRAFVWREGVREDLATPAGWTAAPVDIDDAGVIVGWASTPNGQSAVRWVDGQPVALGPLDPTHVPPGSAAVAVNGGGLIVGFGPHSYVRDGAPASGYTGWSWRPGDAGPVPFQPLDTAVDSSPIDVADDGAVVGSILAPGAGRATYWLWDRVPGPPTLPLPEGFSPVAFGAGRELYGTDVTDLAAGRPQRWNGGATVQALPLPAGTVAAYVTDANRTSVAVGAYRDASGASHAALWADWRVVDLDGFRPASAEWDGWRLTEAVAVSETGWIIGRAAPPPGRTVPERAWLLRPLHRLTVTVQANADPKAPTPDSVVLEARGVTGTRTVPVQHGTATLDLPAGRWVVSASGAGVCVAGETPCQPAATVDLLADTTVGFAIPGRAPVPARFGSGPTRLVLRNGGVAIPVACPRTAWQACRTKLTVSVRPRRPGARPGAVLGSLTVQVAPGRTRVVRVPIARAWQPAIRLAPLQAIARLADTTGARTVRASRALVLVAPPPARLTG